MEVIQAIRGFMMQEFGDSGFDHSVADDESLIERGILDSLGILTLIAFLDEEFGVVPSEDELDPEQFETIELIAKFIKRKAGSA